LPACTVAMVAPINKSVLSLVNVEVKVNCQLVL
jgi:hypothetical protein